MKVALITDLHIGAKNGNLGLHAYFKKFYDEVLFPYIDEHEITNLISLGDSFDNRKAVDLVSLNASKKFLFDQTEKRNMTFHMIVGNHDIPYRNMTSINSPKLLLDDYKSVFVYDKPIEINFGVIKVLFLPWICQENEELCKHALLNSNASAIFGHLELEGFEMYKGYGSKGGMLSDAFQRFPLVCSGHFHHRSSSRNIHYLGCPYEMSWADYNDPKGFHVYDTETNTIKFIENPFKLYHKIFYDDSKGEKYFESDLSKYSGAYVKVIVLEKTKPEWYDKFEKAIRDANPLEVKFEDIKISMDNFEVDGDIFTISADDTFQILKDSIEATNVIDDSKIRLKSLFQELYKDALTIG